MSLADKAGAEILIFLVITSVDINTSSDQLDLTQIGDKSPDYEYPLGLVNISTFPKRSSL